MSYTLPKLNYGYDALEPVIDAQTMEIHYTKHHQGYTDKLNGVLEKYPDIQKKEFSKLLQDLPSLSIEEADRAALQNNGGGYLNHTLFWEVMDPSNKKNEQLGNDIVEQFGSLDSFKEQFNHAALTRFGSGWAWLVRDEHTALQVYSTANQDSPYMNNHTPILGLDVWEHAYYLKYQNRRAEYIEQWWNVIKII